MAGSSRRAYDGLRRKIVLAFDVGTTYSGISYSILDPGQIPGIKGVTRFPAQETLSGASKIPTIIYYDKAGKVMAVGAEATSDGMYEAAQEGHWYKAEWFKLHLRSKFGNGKELHPNVPPLPPNKTVVDVFADFLRYLLSCAASYIKDSHPNGVTLWETHRNDIHFVLSHPNGWEGKEQSQMRQAALKAGLITDTPEEHERISFVTEGEASLHFAIENGILSQAMKGEGIVIVDAGGGTIDVSTYYKRNSQEMKRIFEEIAPPQCYFHGSVFITLKAKDFLKDLLAESPFADDLDLICGCFDKTTKPRFRNAEDPQFIRFGAARDNDATCGVRFGQLKLAGADVAKFFQPSVDCVIQAVIEQEKAALHKISHVILVGGFAASDWLFEEVKRTLTAKRLEVIRPETHVNKAVSDGATSFYLDHYVRTRVAKVTYGSKVEFFYNNLDAEHVKRVGRIFTHAVDGTARLPEGFDLVLPKHTQVSETKEFSKPLVYRYSDTTSSHFECTIMCYRGTSNDPKWIDAEPSNFTTICTLTGDVSRVPKVPMYNPSGGVYYSLTFEVVILFGLTEIQAQLRWSEGGIKRQSPVKLIYDNV